ncbi:MAG: TIGR01459 family HAD-type hydrolase [Pseudomonadota bacterium]
MTARIAGLGEIVERFDGLLVDQFGVLHDGRRAFPGAREALDRAKASGLSIVALTNSGKRSALNAARLERLGFPASLFRSVISSGELAHERIDRMLADGRLRPGARAVLIARDGDRSLVEGKPLSLVPLGGAAEIVLIAGAEPERTDRAAYRAALAPLARAGVPALCANPDTAMYADGRAAFGAGLIAEDYRADGGPVETLGKPGAAMFEAGLAALGTTDPARTLMIGDSPEHDVAGAKAAGCATLLVTDGVQGGTGGGAADYALPRLVW